MRLHWMKDRVKRNIFTIKWKNAQANLGHYPTKAHKPAHHRTMRPIYTYQKDQSPAAMQGCANILEGIAAVRQPITNPASNPLRVSRRAAAIAQKSPSALRASCSSSARPRLA